MEWKVCGFEYGGNTCVHPLPCPYHAKPKQPKPRKPKNKAIPMLLWCPGCHARHVDEGEFKDREHHTHACQACGMVWRPSLLPTVGVQFLPGFKNEVVK